MNNGRLEFGKGSKLNVFVAMVLVLVAWLGTSTARAQDECVVSANGFTPGGLAACFVNQPCDIQVWPIEGGPWECSPEGGAYIGFDASSTGNAQSAATAMLYAFVPGTGIPLSETWDVDGNEWLEGSFTPAALGYYAVALTPPTIDCYAYDTQAVIVAIQIQGVESANVLNAPDDPTGANCDRTTIGVGESVNLTLVEIPMTGLGTVSAEVGGEYTDGGTLSSYSSFTPQYTATDNAGEEEEDTTVYFTVTLGYETGSTTIGFNVLAPTDVHLIKLTSDAHIQGDTSAGFALAGELLPFSVNFSAVYFQEQYVAATSATGTPYSTSRTSHPVGPVNSVAGVTVAGGVTWSNLLSNGDKVTDDVGPGAATGGYEWDIPVNFSLNPSSVNYTFGTLTQIYTATSGTAQMQKSSGTDTIQTSAIPLNASTYWPF